MQWIILMSQAWNWVKEKMERLGCTYINWGLAWMLGRCADKCCSSNVHALWFSTGRLEQMIVTSFHDVTRISHAIEGGNYKRRAQLNLGSVIRVFWCKAFRSINKPQTLYFGYLSASCGAEYNQNGPCDLFIHMHVHRSFWGTFSQDDFSCLMLSG